MKIDDALLNEVADLVFLVMDGGISDEQLAVLEKLLLENPKARDYYFDLIYTCIGLNESEGILSLGGVLDVNSPTWKLLADYENQAEPADIETPAKAPEIVRVVPVEKVPHPVSKLALYTAIVSAAAMLVVMAYVYFNPRGFSRDVATVTDSLDAQWGQPFKVSPGTRLFTNESPMVLQSGLVRIAYDEGVEVVLEGPAKYRIVDSFVIALEYGRLYAHVAASGKGFTVETANARIVDLGTEFGVQAESGGHTELHVFRGKTTLIAGSSAAGRSAQLITEGSARRIGGGAGAVVETIAPHRELFASRFDSGSKLIWRGQMALDLADIVSGGNGLGTGLPNTGLSVFTGNPVYTDDNLEFVQGPDGYRPVSCTPLIDGVFIPKTPNQAVSSGEHLFEECPATEGFTWGGVITTGIGFKSGIPGIVNHYYVLDGMTYGRGKRPCVNMHSNIGITFDLDAIRGQVQDLKISKFTAICGLSRTFYDYVKFNPHTLPKAEFFVVVDGTLCFASGAITPDSGGLPIDVTLESTARFLTLIVTQGSDDPAFDWGLFAEPKLHLERDSRDSVQVRQ